MIGLNNNEEKLFTIISKDNIDGLFLNVNLVLYCKICRPVRESVSAPFPCDADCHKQIELMALFCILKAVI